MTRNLEPCPLSSFAVSIARAAGSHTDRLRLCRCSGGQRGKPQVTSLSVIADVDEDTLGRETGYFNSIELLLTCTLSLPKNILLQLHRLIRVECPLPRQSTQSLPSSQNTSPHQWPNYKPSMLFPTGLIAIILNLISGYALIQSLTSISNIKKYEKKAEKAADWSSTAETRLWDTRYTIGAGFVSVSPALVQF